MPRTRARLARPDCEIYYEVDGDGPPLFFAHGLGGNHLSWWQQVPHFRATHTCVTFSHRGFFPSTAPADGPHPKDYAGDLAALADHLGFTRFAFVGQSMGGWTGIEFALAHPGRLTALVLAATSGPIDPTKANAPGFDAWAERGGRIIPEGIAQGIHPAVGPRGGEEQPDFNYLYRAMDELSALDKEMMRKRLFASRTRHPDELAAIPTPTLWLTGAEDLVFPSLVAPLLAAKMPNARHMQIPRAGHSA